MGMSSSARCRSPLPSWELFAPQGLRLEDRGSGPGAREGGASARTAGGAGLEGGPRRLGLEPPWGRGQGAAVLSQGQTAGQAWRARGRAHLLGRWCRELVCACVRGVRRWGGGGPEPLLPVALAWPAVCSWLVMCLDGVLSTAEPPSKSLSGARGQDGREEPARAWVPLLQSPGLVSLSPHGSTLSCGHCCLLSRSGSWWLPEGDFPTSHGQQFNTSSQLWEGVALSLPRSTPWGALLVPGILPLKQEMLQFCHLCIQKT